MMRLSWISFNLLMILGTATLVAQPDQLVKSEIVDAQLFKNSWAMVTESFTTHGAGTYFLGELPEAAHGSFWIHDDHVAQTRVVHIEVDEPLELNDPETLADAMVGSEATLFLSQGGQVSGKILAHPVYERSQSVWVLEGPDDHTFVHASAVVYSKVEKSPKTAKLVEKVKKPFLRMTVKTTTPTSIRFSYLTWGLGWAPSYRLQLTSEDQLTIQQKSVIRNVWRDLKNTNVQLISGFPNVQFGHVRSLISPTTTWDHFFSDLNKKKTGGTSLLNHVSSQSVLVNYSPGIDPSSLKSGVSGEDLYFHDIGKLGLKQNHTYLHETARESASYRREVTWEVSDRRRHDGRLQNRDPQHGEGTERDQDLWDTIIFKNPFTFPMTTAPAIVFRKNQLLGQTKSTWVNPGSSHRLRVSKALSIEVQDREWVVDQDRPRVKVLGQNYEREKVNGALYVRNTRGQAVALRITKRFTGELIEAQGEPTQTLLEEGAYQINRRNQLVWQVVLAPGEKRTLDFSYQILVKR